MMTVVLGCDPHLDTFDVVAVDEVGREVAAAHLGNEPAGWAGAVALAARLDAATIGIEAASGFGRGLATAAQAAGMVVVEIPTRLTGGLRRREGGGKTDRGDARAVARLTLRGEGIRWCNDPHTEALRVVVHYRKSLVRAQTRAINQLRALVAEIDPATAAGLPPLRSGRAFEQFDTFGDDTNLHTATVSALIRALAGSCRQRLDTIRDLEHQIEQLLPAQGQRLRSEIHGIGLIVAATIVAEAAGTDGFATDAKMASWAGIAPLDASSGRHSAHRLNRGGNRQANAAIHTIALVQSRSYQPAIDYLARRRQNGDDHRKAIRALKRHIIRRVHKTLQLT
jgi:transposase